jgi:hypothetical protein
MADLYSIGRATLSDMREHPRLALVSVGTFLMGILLGIVVAVGLWMSGAIALVLMVLTVLTMLTLLETTRTRTIVKAALRTRPAISEKPAVPDKSAPPMAKDSRETTG